HNEDGIEKFSGKLDAQQLHECKLSGGKIKQQSGGTAGGFLHRAFHRLVLLLSGCIRARFVSRKMIKATSVAKVCFKSSSIAASSLNSCMPVSPSGSKSWAMKLQINIAIPPRIAARKARGVIITLLVASF